MLLLHVTLCLLITYHWPGCSAAAATAAAASTGPATRATDAGIAAEVNGSPTDARLNIPVVKRSSNQAAFANELRSAVSPRWGEAAAAAAAAAAASPSGERGGGSSERGRKARGLAAPPVAVVEVVPTHSGLPHEYANRDVEKYTGKEATERATSIVAGAGIARPVKEDVEEEEEKKEKEEKKKEEEEELGEERGKSGPGIKSSIAAKDAGDPRARLIGKANSPPAAAELRPRRRFDYERASSASEPREGKRTREAARKNSVRDDDYGSNISGDSVGAGPVFAPDLATDSIDWSARRIRRQAGTGESAPLASNDGKIDGEFATPTRNRDDDDHDATGPSSRLSSSSSSSSSSALSPSSASLLKPREHQPRQTANSVGGFAEILDSRGQHQQSRNTRPSAIIQHLRRNAKRQISDDNLFARSPGFDGKHQDLAASGLGRPIAFYRRNQRETNRRQIPNSVMTSGTGPELRFIPANRHRGHENRVYFQRTLKPLTGFKGFRGNEASGFGSGEANPRQPIGGLNAAQFESLENSIRGVFDKYEARQQGQSDLLPNVRMIQANRIFVAPPRLIYDTKILPAPFGFDTFFQAHRDDGKAGSEDAGKSRDPGFAIQGVFDQSHKETAQDQREVIPVREEDSSASLANTGNFVTPLPPPSASSYPATAAGGEVSVRVNQPGEEPNVLDEIYRVNGEQHQRQPGILELGNVSQPYGTTGDEDSRSNHESTIGAGDERHLGAELDGRGSSYDNSAGTSSGAGNRPESGSTNVDHSAVIEGTTDEYVNRGPSAVHPNRVQSAPRGFGTDSGYDRGSYKWRDDNNHMHYAANYSFGYRVSDHQTENEFGHQETRTEGITNGKYHVRLPDGRIQKVNYYVDDGGYHASVSYRRDE